MRAGTSLVLLPEAVKSTKQDLASTVPTTEMLYYNLIILDSVATASPAIYKELVTAGVNRDRIHLEYFTPFVTVELEE
jgi:hypothetical protein